LLFLHCALYLLSSLLLAHLSSVYVFIVLILKVCCHSGEKSLNYAKNSFNNVQSHNSCCSNTYICNILASCQSENSNHICENWVNSVHIFASISITYICCLSIICKFSAPQLHTASTNGTCAIT